MRRFSGSRLVFAGLLVSLFAVACGEDAADDDDCNRGDEGCRCKSDDTCDPGLVCDLEADECYEPSGGGSSGRGGSAGRGGSSGSAGRGGSSGSATAGTTSGSSGSTAQGGSSTVGGSGGTAPTAGFSGSSAAGGTEGGAPPYGGEGGEGNDAGEAGSGPIAGNGGSSGSGGYAGSSSGNGGFSGTSPVGGSGGFGGSTGGKGGFGGFGGSTGGKGGFGGFGGSTGGFGGFAGISGKGGTSGSAGSTSGAGGSSGTASGGTGGSGPGTGGAAGSSGSGGSSGQSCTAITLGSYAVDTETAPEITDLIFQVNQELGTSVTDLLDLLFYDYGAYDGSNTGTFTLGTGADANWATCSRCLLLSQDDDAKLFFASAGTLTLLSDSHQMMGYPRGSLTNVTLREVTISGGTSTPVTNGQCVTIASASFSVPPPTANWYDCPEEYYSDGTCDCGCGALDATSDCGEGGISACDYCWCPGEDGECDGSAVSPNNPAVCVLTSGG